MRRVLLLVFTEIVKDPRVMRHLAALRETYEVATCGLGEAPPGVVAHYRLPSAKHLPLTPAGVTNLMLRRTEAAYRRFPDAKLTRELLADAPFDLVIANDINTLPVALEVAGDRPVIADLHEYAPRQFEGDWRWRMLVQPFNEDLCRTYLPRAAAVTAVCDGIGEEYRRCFGVDPVTITNAAPDRNPQYRPAGEVVRAVHSGYAQPNRQLEFMIEAAAGLPGVTLDCYLAFSERNRKYRDRLRAMAQATGNVVVHDPVPMRELPDALDAYDLGIFVLPPASFNQLHTLPNKFFDFVQSGLGVMVGPSPEMATLTEEYSLGQVLPDFAGSTLRNALRALEPGVVSEWKAASCDAASALSSDREAERLREVAASVL